MIATPPIDQRELHWQSVEDFLTTDCLGNRGAIGGVILKGIDWILGRTVEPKGQKECLREGISLFGFLGTVIVALFIYAQADREPDVRVIALYAALAAVSMIGLLSLCMNRVETDSGSSEPAFLPQHRRILWRITIAVFFVVSGTGYGYWTRNLSKEGIAGIFRDTKTANRAFVFERALADTGYYRWHAQLDDGTSQAWKLENVFCYPDQNLADRDDDLSRTYALTTETLMAGGYFCKAPGTYYFVVRIEENQRQHGRTQKLPTKEDISFHIDQKH